MQPLSITPRLRQQLAEWLQEDLGRGDLSAPALQGVEGVAHCVAKAPGVFCGGVLVEPLLRELVNGQHHCSVEGLVSEGVSVEAGDVLLQLRGSAETLVALERTALNLAMRLSGIATATAALVAQLEGTGVGLADTRKTTPGLRVLEKYAVRMGGGSNHRMGLWDAAMIKDNHVLVAGSVAEAVQREARHDVQVPEHLADGHAAPVHRVDAVVTAERHRARRQTKLLPLRQEGDLALVHAVALLRAVLHGDADV